MSNCPFILYAFLSPRFGIKLALKTDLSLSADIKDSKTEFGIKFRTAYKLAKGELRNWLDRDVQLDSSGDRYAQGCYLSHDPNRYYNPQCKTLPVREMVEKTHRDEMIALEKKQSDPSRSLNHVDNPHTKASPEKIDDLLSHIPKYLPFNERQPINFSVINELGEDAYWVLMDHWSGVKNREKLSRDIKNEILGADGRITIGTLIFQAQKHGYTSSHNEEIQEAEKPPTYWATKYYTKEECSTRIKYVIFEEFFAQQKSKVLLVEAGAGKSKTLIRCITDYLLENTAKRVAVFLKTHDHIEQFYNDVLSNIAEVDQQLERQTDTAWGKNRVSFLHKPHIIKSQSKLCLEYEDQKKLIHDEGTRLCEDCWYREEGSCKYHNQFEFADFPSNLRIYTFDRLFLKPKYDKDWTPDYVVIDEDIVGKVRERSPVFSLTKNDEYPSIRKLQIKIHERNDLCESASQLFGELLEDRLIAEKKLEKCTEKLKRNDGNYHTTLKLKKHLECWLDAFDELSLLGTGTIVQSSKIWVRPNLSVQGGMPHIQYGSKVQLAPEYLTKPTLILDASGEKEVIEAALNKKLQFEEVRVQQQPNAKVYQFTGKASFSKHAFLANTQLATKVEKWIESIQTKRMGLITYKDVSQYKNGKDEVDRLERIKYKFNSFKTPNRHYGYFGNIRGMNDFEGCDVLIVLGQHRLPNFETYDLTQLFFRKEHSIQTSVQSADLSPDLVLHRDYVEKVYRMKTGPNWSIRQKEYTHPLTTLISNHFEKAETYQAIHRLRMIHGNEPKTLYILSDAVLDVSVDALLNKDKELGVKNIRLIEYVKENYFLVDSNEAFAKVFGCKESAAKEFRSKAKGSGGWLMEHRHLKHWKFHIENRDGKNQVKLYSWHDQKEADVRHLLEADGFRLK